MTRKKTARPNPQSINHNISGEIMLHTRIEPAMSGLSTHITSTLTNSHMPLEAYRIMHVNSMGSTIAGKYLTRRISVVLKVMHHKEGMNVLVEALGTELDGLVVH